MPVCPHCGHDTTDPRRASAPPAVDRSMTQGGRERGGVHVRPAPRRRRSRARGSSQSVTAEPDAGDASSSGCSRGTALLVVRRGPASGARFLLDSDVTTAGRHPDSDIFLDDITVSRHHAEFREVRRRRSASATSAASTAPTSTAAGSTTPSWSAATRCRSASTASCS